MKETPHPHIVLANDAKGPSRAKAPIRLEYIPTCNDSNVKIGLPQFVQNVYYLPDRILDLLEIAGYVFAADRYIFRGPKIAVEYQAWSRSIEFYIRVRDQTFWSQQKVTDALSHALEFMTGDAKYSFHFEAGHKTPPTGLFDQPVFSVKPGETVHVTLFSGGLDSLCGTLELLQSQKGKVVLVSHQSQSSTIHTQNAIVKELKTAYHNRVLHYPFECTLRGIRATEESQRTRSFLYTSIAFAIASAYGQNVFYVFENGVTSLNLRRREDLANARASRTTHPQTIGRLAKLFSLINNKPFDIQLPLLYKTKADVISSLQSKMPTLISSAVSCTRAFKTIGQATHCGQCFQCVDRRIAMHAAEAENWDHRGLYTVDIINESINDAEARTTVVDYVRQALGFAQSTAAHFEDEYLSDLAAICNYVPKGKTDAEKISALWDLYRQHGMQVKKAIAHMRDIYEDLGQPLPAYSLLQLVSAREHLKPEQERLAATIAAIINPAIGDMFSRNKPRDEPDLNSKIGALIRTHNAQLQSEHPNVSFACAKVIPDHTLPSDSVLIEAKYIRGKTSPSQVTDGIAADLTKYPQEAFILFVVYDPQHRILSDSIFSTDIQAKGRNRVLIIR